VQHVAFGDEADACRASARGSGVASLTASLAPDWRTADALVLAG
jgi:hypothetical protein